MPVMRAGVLHRFGPLAHACTQEGAWPWLSPVALHAAIMTPKGPSCAGDLRWAPLLYSPHRRRRRALPVLPAAAAAGAATACPDLLDRMLPLDLDDDCLKLMFGEEGEEYNDASASTSLGARQRGWWRAQGSTTVVGQRSPSPGRWIGWARAGTSAAA